MTDNPIDDLQQHLEEYVRHIKETDEKGAAKIAPLPKPVSRWAHIRASTLSAVEGPDAANVVESYFRELAKMDRLVSGIAQLMVKHEHDPEYQRKARREFRTRCIIQEANLKAILAAWAMGNQHGKPN